MEYAICEIKRCPRRRTKANGGEVKDLITDVLIILVAQLGLRILIKDNTGFLVACFILGVGMGLRRGLINVRKMGEKDEK